MKKTDTLKKLLSVLLCFALVAGFFPHTATAAAHLVETAIAETITDPGTADSWETMMGTEADGNRYAGRVWVDKSVYQDGDTAILNTSGEAGSTFPVTLKENEAFQIVFSALGSTMTTKEFVTTTGPMDVVLVLDTSTSMDDEDSNGVTRFERTITAANELLNDLLSIKNVRIAVVTYNVDSETVLPLAAYNNGIDLEVTNYHNDGSANAGVVTAYDKDRKVLGKDSGFAAGSNLQSGIDRGFGILAEAKDIKNRVPVAIVLTDGLANRANPVSFYEIGRLADPKGISAEGRNLYLGTLLNAAYSKTKAEVNYGKDATVYTVGVDITDNVTAKLLMNPADVSGGFNAKNSNAEVTQAYSNFLKWAKGETLTADGWTFDHHYPKANGKINDARIAANINYADKYFDISNAELAQTFDHIYKELSSGAFNPISSSTSVDGGTGEDNTPLIYVDFIGQHMEIKEIQAVTLFGNSYGVVRNAKGDYTVIEAIGTNPTTNERWNTAEDIQISVTEHDGVQKLEIRINQEILPVIMEQAVSETIADVTTSTLTELRQPPLRVYYTVGIDSDILLPGGRVDVSALQNYSHIDDKNGTVSFYSNRFGLMNEGDGGDAHVGFKPSLANRFYYHQSNQGIFTKITNKSDGSTVRIPENNEYGIVWDENKYDLTWMTYTDYQRASDTDKVYTYVSYYRPTLDTADAESAAEEVTYLVYTDWKYLKDSVAFYDAAAGTYLNEGKAVAQTLVEDTVAAYTKAHPNAEIHAVLGVGSLRTSRLHNMMVYKVDNETDTAPVRYAPEYTHETAAVHNGNDVVVWLGNNGRLTVQIDTGIALTKAVTESIGDADDTYALTVTVPDQVKADPQVVDEEGNLVNSTYQDHVLTVKVRAGQTVYVSGIPGGTVCEIGEKIVGDYYIADQTKQVRIPLVKDALNGAAQFVPAVVTNAPNKYGNLFITKEITSDHAVPVSVLDTMFELTVNLGTDMAGEMVTVANSERPTLYGVMADENGNLKFRIKARQTIELLRLPEGTKVTVTEAVPDDHFAVSYRTRNHSGEAADTDNTLVIPSEGNATAVVLNHYTPSPVSVKLDIAGTKILTAEGSHDGGQFVYQVQKWNGSGWENISGKTASTAYGGDEAGEKSFTIENVLESITFAEVGSYAYQVIEVKGDVPNVTYDRTLYTFNVTVTDNGGQLVAAVTDLNSSPITDGIYEVTFRNTYHTAPVSVDIIKNVENKSGDTTVSKAGFEFKAVQTDADWKPLKGEAASELRVYSDAAGEARLTATYKQAGVYRYILSETEKNAPGWIYSDAQYRITVTVTEENGEITAAMEIEKVNGHNTSESATVDFEDATRGTVSFLNIYDPQDAVVDLDHAVTKELTGMKLEPGQFKFYVYQDGDRKTPLLTGTNAFDGDLSFVDFDQVLTFETEGKYQFDILEHIPADAVYDPLSGKYVRNGMHYDSTVYDLVVEVFDDSATGKLIASYYFEDAVSNVVTFHNSYKAEPVQYAMAGTKILHGRAPKAGEFTFELYEGDTLKQTVSNLADGSFRFRPITYTRVGVYTYTIKEVGGNVAGIRYDGTEKPVKLTVTVTDTDGILNAVASISNERIKFENTYEAAPAQITFHGTKRLAGGVPQNGAYTFNLYSTDHSFDTTGSSAKLIAIAKNLDGAFTFVRKFNATGTYYFVLLEDAAAEPVPGVVYDRTQHRFMVKVSDIGDGQLKAAVSNMNTGASTSSAAAVSADVIFTNATFASVVRKDVYYAEDIENGIDGQKVNAGDILTYRISYANYTGEDVVINVMDVIPEHTSFVAGSASHNGGYAGTHVNWILRVEKGRTITLSFDVRVNESNVIVHNSAMIRDGINTYYTNKVVNHTVEDVFKKDVFTPEDPTVSIDGKTVQAGDELLYQISFTNTFPEDVNVTLTDRIPEHTVYVEGSADNDGVYNNGILTWTKKLEAGAVWTVTFKVKVGQTGGVAIKNKATILAGEQEYTTNVVSNPVAKSDIPPIPETDDIIDLRSWCALLLISCVCLLAVAYLGKKRKYF